MMTISKKKVAIGLSGGVDSALAAHLLIEQGYQVTAVRFPCLGQSCQNQQDRLDAKNIASQLQIPFREVALPKKHQDQIVAYFVNEYQRGKTPNPDVICNQIIKFGWFYDWTLANNFDYLATGHYAQIIRFSRHQNYLATSRDMEKDQTYFLHRLHQQQLKHILFPIGHLNKKQVRSEAANINLPVAKKESSSGLCFVCNLSVRQYLQQQLGTMPGEVVTEQGKVIGRHQGLWFYTIGQRRGFSVNKKLVQQNTKLLELQADLPPLYVVAKNIEQNQLVVGPKLRAKSNCFNITNLHLISEQTDLSTLPLKVKIRHQGQLINCDLHKSDEGWQIELSKSAFAVSPGQFAVFYTNQQNLLPPKTKYANNLICLGGGEIANLNNH